MQPVKPKDKDPYDFGLGTKPTDPKPQIPNSNLPKPGPINTSPIPGQKPADPPATQPAGTERKDLLKNLFGAGFKK